MTGRRTRGTTADEAGLLPYRPEAEAPEREGGLVAIDDTGGVFEVLSSATARSILARLYESPGPASDVAGRVDTSLQNATYHLSRLLNADLVAVIDTWYSSRGRAMSVYAPTVEPLVLVAGSSTSKRTVARAIEESDAPGR